MSTTKEKTIIMGKFLAANISCSILQVFVVGGLALLHVFISILSEDILSRSIENGLLLSNLSLIIGSGAVAVIYGLVWLVFWTAIYKDGIKWFYYRVAFLTIPLPALLYWLYKIQDPDAIMSTYQETVFISIVTGIILLPIYSVSIYKLILKKKKDKLKNTILVCTANLLLGVLIYALSWNVMVKAESTNLEKENLAGIKLMELADKKALEENFVELTYNLSDGKGTRGYAAYKVQNLALAEVDANNWITAIRVSRFNRMADTKLRTERNIGPGSTVSDMLKAYGNSCYKRSDRDFMGDGGDYYTYIDRENDITLEFYFVVFGSGAKDEEGVLDNITLRKGK